MKRLTFKIGIALLTFIVGLVATVLVFVPQKPITLEPANVNFCDLVRDSDEYSQKVMRVEALLYFSNEENGVLYGEQCPSRALCTNVAFDVRAFTEAEAALERAYRYGDSRDSKRAKVVVVGKFFRWHDRGYSPIDGCRFGFDISRIERVESAPDGAAWR